MSAKLLENFFAGLGKEGRELVDFYLPAFGFFAEVKDVQNAKPDDSQAAVLIDIGEPTGPREFLVPKDPVKATAYIAEVLDKKDFWVDFFATREQENVERELCQCIFPDISLLREASKSYPIFGYLVCYHDLGCYKCGLNTDEAHCEQEAAAESYVHNASYEDQQALIRWAQMLVDEAGPLLLECRNDDDAKDADYSLSAIQHAAHPEGRCIYLETANNKALLWEAELPPLLEGALNHCEECAPGRRALLQFEKSLVPLLPPDMRQLYRRACNTMMGKKNFVFEYTA